MRKLLTTWGVITLMLVLVVGTVAAQSGLDATATPTAVPTSQPAGSTLYLHPIVQILSAYFGRTTRPMLPTPTPTASPTVDLAATATEVSNGTPTATPTATPVAGPEEFAQQIAMYHDEGIGFGVLVKLYAMAEDSVKACVDQQSSGVAVDQPACEVVTVEQLVSEFQSGVGMGQLFKEHGKPGLLGVGQVRKALQNQPQATPTPTPGMTSGDLQFQNQNSNNGNGHGNKPVGGKPPKSHGRNK